MKKRTIALMMIFVVPNMAIAQPENLPLVSGVEPIPSGKSFSLNEMSSPITIKNLTHAKGDYRVWIDDENTTRQLSNASQMYKKNVVGVVIIATMDGFGSGVVVSPNEIVTNHHVVEGYNEALILEYSSNVSGFQDVKEQDFDTVKVVGVDINRDLALLRSNTEFSRSKIQEFGRHNSISIADDVFAIGHPLGHLWSFTYGVVSALPSPYVWSYDNQNEHSANCIQTQTPINPGNSGGPLYNSEGELIGINSMAVESDGLNFAVRIDEIVDFIERARKGDYPAVSDQLGEEFDWQIIPDHGLEDVYACWGADTTGDGKYDNWLIFQDSDGVEDYWMIDTNGTGVPDILYDIKEDVWLNDSNDDAEFDQVGVDKDGDGWPDYFKDM